MKDCIRPAKWALFGPDPKSPNGAMLAAVYCGQHKPRIHRDGIGRLIKYDAVLVRAAGITAGAVSVVKPQGTEETGADRPAAPFSP